MRRLALLAAVIIGAALAGEGKPEPPPVSFRAVDVSVDSGEAALAAYQVEVAYDARRVKVVGVEGGERDGFRDAPYFDEAGKTGGRIVLGAFVADDGLAGKGAQRVARLHLAVEGAAAPECSVKLVTAARPGGKRIQAAAEVKDSGSAEEKGK
jgi:hypothetical protein